MDWYLSCSTGPKQTNKHEQMKNQAKAWEFQRKNEKSCHNNENFETSAANQRKRSMYWSILEHCWFGFSKLSVQMYLPINWKDVPLNKVSKQTQSVGKCNDSEITFPKKTLSRYSLHAYTHSFCIQMKLIHDLEI